MSLTRWFFRWVQDGSIDKILESLTVKATLGVTDTSKGAFFVERPGLIVIGFHPSFWKLERKTWFRGCVREAIEVITGRMPGSMTKITEMVWSNDEAAFDQDLSQARVRVLDEAASLEESRTIWSWIAHVVSQPIAFQKGAGHKEFVEWRARTCGSGPTRGPRRR